jgi:hypothetical protein
LSFAWERKRAKKVVVDKANKKLRIILVIFPEGLIFSATMPKAKNQSQKRGRSIL